jgi:hypothetical protein
MPDDMLEDAITRWRTELEVEQGLGRLAAEELEAHLRDQIDALVGEGALTPDEAFLVARHRLGPPAKLGVEFAKLAPWRGWLLPLSWMAAGVLGMRAAHVLVRLVIDVAVLVAGEQGMNMRHLMTLAAVLSVVLPLLVLVGVVIWARRTPLAPTAMLGRPLLTLLVAGLGYVGANFAHAQIFQRYQYYLGRHLGIWQAAELVVGTTILLIIAVAAHLAQRRVRA